MTATTRKADRSRAGLLHRLGARVHELEMDRIARRVKAREYREIKANLDRQVEAVRAMPC